MISHLKGTVEKVADNYVILDVNGVGYKVICSSRITNSSIDISGVIHIFTELIVREDSWNLYGFLSEEERFWFNKLTSVQGVGGKAAIAILSALSDDEIYNAFLNGDKHAFTRADGVGLKLASRIISELKDKVVGKIDTFAPQISSSQSNDTGNSGVINDVISALVNLGYQKSDVYRLIYSMKISDDIGFDELLRKVLNKISSNR